jgi:hypothetical protein
MPKVKNSIKNGLKLAYPPKLSVDDLLEKLRKNNLSKPGKIPNCFLIYRILWVDRLKKERTKLNLAEISEFVSTQWKNEKQEVREFYKRLSAAAKRRYNEINKSRVFIYHNKCNATENEIVPTSTTNISSLETATENLHISIPFEVSSFNSPTQQIQQIQQTQQQQPPQPQFNPNFTYDPYSSFSTSPIMNDLNFHQNCSLKDTINDTLNSLSDTINNFKTFNLNNPEELGKFEKFHVKLKSIINERKIFAHFHAIREKFKELENITSSPFIGIKDNPHYGFDLTRGIGIHEIPQEYIFSNEPESYIDDLLTPLSSSPSAIGYPNYLVDNTTFSQLNNNYYLLERTKELEEKFRCTQELLKAMGGLIFGNR